MQRASILFTLGLSLTACAADGGDEGIFFAKNIAPADGCTFSASASEEFRVHGVSSVFGSGYMMYPQLVSKISATETNVQQRTIQLRGARIDLETIDADLSGIDSGLKKFETRFSAPLAPNGGITDAAFLAIPPGFLKAVRDKKGITAQVNPMAYETEVIVHAKVFGDLAGSEVTSQDYEFPVTITSRGVTNIISSTCPVAAGSSVTAPTNSCSPYQDGIADCCVQDGELQCPPTVGAGQVMLTGIAVGAGTITVAPGMMSCSPTIGADCSESYSVGTMVVPTATPRTGATFTGFSGACTGTAACTITMDAAKSLTATFTAPLTVTVTGTGTVTSAPAGISCSTAVGSDCTEAYTAGSSVTLTAAPPTGTWGGGSCSGAMTTPCVLTMNDSKTVSAAF